MSVPQFRGEAAMGEPDVPMSLPDLREEDAAACSTLSAPGS